MSRSLVPRPIPLSFASTIIHGREKWQTMGKAWENSTSEWHQVDVGSAGWMELSTASRPWTSSEALQLSQLRWCTDPGPTESTMGPVPPRYNLRPPDVIHEMNSRRPFLFFFPALLLLCVIASTQTKEWKVRYYPTFHSFGLRKNNVVHRPTRTVNKDV